METKIPVAKKTTGILHVKKENGNSIPFIVF